MIRAGISGLAYVVMVTGVLAGPFDGVFVSNGEACAWLINEGSQALFEHDFLALTLKDGIVANEFHCEFVDIKEAFGGDARLISAMCEYPGEPFPDLISLREFDENSITVTSLHKSFEDASYGAEGTWGSQTYTRCDLKELPQ